MGRRFVDMRTVQQRMAGLDIKRQRETRQREESAMHDLVPAGQYVPAVTTDQVALIKRTIAKDATDDELALFIHDCARQGVHPLDKLIHFTKRNGKYTPITSIDFLRIRAGDSGECVGSDDAIFTGTPMTASFEARVTVYRLVHGHQGAFSATARWSEYKPDQDFMWKKMPHVMLAKCAEALALRKAFPKQLAGLYVKEEMEQAGADVTSPVIPPLTKSLTPSPGPAAVEAAIADPGAGAPVAPANLNLPIPDAWVPFVKTDSVTTTIVAGKRSKSTGKTTITLDTGEECWTLDHEVATAAIAFKEQQTPITVTLTDRQEIVTLAEATDAAF
jgi:phage recombination protein Bet